MAVNFIGSFEVDNALTNGPATETDTEIAETILAVTSSGNAHLAFGYSAFKCGIGGKWAEARLKADDSPPRGFADAGRFKDDQTTTNIYRHQAIAWTQDITTDIAWWGSRETGGNSQFFNWGSFLIDIEDIVDDATQFVQADTDHGGFTLTVDMAEYETLTFTPNEIGEEWLILACASWQDNNTAFTDCHTQLQINQSTVDSAHNHVGNAGPEVLTSVVMADIFTAVDTAAQTVDLDIDANGTGNSLKETHLIAIRLKSISTNYTLLESASYEIVGAGAAEDTGLDLVHTPAGANDLFLFGKIKNDPDSASGFTWWFTDDSDSTQTPPLFLSHVINEDADTDAEFNVWLHTKITDPADTENTWEIYVRHANAAASLHDMFFLAMDLDGGSAPDPAGSSGGGGSRGGGNRRGGGNKGGGGGGGSPGGDGPGGPTRVSGGTWF